MRPRYRMCWSHAQNGTGLNAGCGPWDYCRARIDRSVAFGVKHHGISTHWVEADPPRMQ